MDIFESYMKKAASFLNEDEDDEIVSKLGEEEETDEDAELPPEGDEEEMGEEGDTEEVDLESMTKAELIDYIKELQANCTCDKGGMCPCPDCNGEGVIEDEDGEETECETCGGSGEVPCEEQEMELDLENPVCPNCGCHLNVLDGEEGDMGDEELGEYEDDFGDIDLDTDEDEEEY